MAQARQNPIGSLKGDLVVVQVGKGKHTHVYNPATGLVLCNSGKNAGRKKPDGTNKRSGPQTVYRSTANFVTCYRCQKLMMLNEKKK